MLSSLLPLPPQLQRSFFLLVLVVPVGVIPSMVLQLALLAPRVQPPQPRPQDVHGVGLVSDVRGLLHSFVEVIHRLSRQEQ